MSSADRNMLSRRRLLLQSAMGMGAVSLGAKYPLVQRAWAGEPTMAHPLAPKSPHFMPRAKRVIMLFMTGGVSHVDSFDPKPELNKRAGEDSRKNGRKWKASLWDHKPRGRSGIETTDLFPHISDQIDDITLIRSMYGDFGDHFEATLHMHNGYGTAMPSMGAWVSYGLGTANPNLPSHVVFAARKPYAGAQVWDSVFLPAYHQGMQVSPGGEPIPYVRPHESNAKIQSHELALLEKLNGRHMSGRSDSNQLPARQLAYQTAESLQNVAPEVFTLSDETDATLDLYNVQGRDDNASFGWQCLMARRLAERDVRFIELIDTGANNNWDQHANMPRHGDLAKVVDKPIAGLLQDLKQRGMLDDTLVVWCTEFGRTPFEDSNATGRGHWRNGFTTWLAGGGVKRGHVHGKTDEMGWEPAENGVHTHDFHATILALLGLDHTQLHYPHGGRNFRLTDVHGHVVDDIFA
ncbi:MAG: DUF1501 domain-containing protein [Phycisphaeraceae bacterium]